MPRGPRPDKFVRDALIRALQASVRIEDPVTKKRVAVRRLDRLAASMINKAIDGDSHMAALIADRVDGKVTVPISGPDDGPIELSSVMEKLPTEDLEQLERIARIVAAGARVAPRTSGRG